MPPARRIRSIGSAGASRVSSCEAASCSEGLDFTFHSLFTLSAHDLKVPLPSKTPLSPAFPGSTTVLMARSPCPLPSAACPRTPPSHPPLELLPTCSAVTQVARTAVHVENILPSFRECSPCLLQTHSGLICPVVLLLVPRGRARARALNACLSQRHAFLH